ncbi:MAG TPA: DUF2254 domain-containing protein [Longimicrobiaceae bacterium]|nr:DUF2254 domain-containing protein [Longimicrobiaceae bacterium]
MRLGLVRLWQAVRASYWFIPSLMAAGAVLLSVAMVRVDTVAGGLTQRLGWIYSGGPEGARAVLSVIGGSVMGTAGVTFSITIAALSLASGQFGPRILYNFMRDTGNQVVLGTFIATFIYCVLVLRSVRGGEAAERYVPHLSVTVGVALGLASLGVLIYFIHHVSISIQAPHVVAGVARDLHHHIDRVYPQRIGHDPDPARERRVADEVPEDFDRRAAAVISHHNGYLQAIDEEQLMELATGSDLLVRVETRPGAFLLRGGRLLSVWPPERLDEELDERLRAAFALGAQRTHLQDVEFSVDQLVEVGVRALSPGINDPFTAMNCLDRLGAALCHAAGRDLPSPFRLDDAGKLRVIARSRSVFAGLVDASFNQLRQYGRSSVSVTVRILETIARVLACVEGDEEQAALLRQAEMTVRGAREAVSEPQDLEDVEQRYRAVLRAAGRPG